MKVRLVAATAPVLALLALGPRDATAQTPPPPAVSLSSVPEPAPPLPDPARTADPHADRVVFIPTAYTHPKGTVFVSVYDIVIWQFGYAVTDHTQISLTSVPPVGQDTTIIPLDLSLKTAVWRQGQVRAAATGSITGLAGAENLFIFAGRVGGSMQFCADETCVSSLTLGANAVILGPIVLMVTALGGVLRIGTSWDLLVELESLVPLGRELGQAHGLALSGGLRYRGAKWGMDFAVARPLDPSTDVPFLPLVVISRRFLP